jgi:hypothetical protein
VEWGFNTRKSKNKKCTKITLSYFLGFFFRRLFYWKNFFCLGALNNNNKNNNVVSGILVFFFWLLEGMCLIKMLLLRLWLLKGKKKKEVFKHKTFPATKVFHQIKLGGGGGFI